mgnify:CR=1 FL=1
MLTILAGCALPGYNSSSFGNHWYNFGGNTSSATYQQKLSQEQHVNYKPVVMKITPQLIRHLNHKQNKQKLRPKVRRLTGSPSQKNYVVGKGDILKIIVFGHPQLTNPGGKGSSGGGRGGNSRQNGRVNTNGELVKANGDMFFPYVGRIHAAGKTTAQIRRQITHGLSSYIRQPQVDVRVAQYRSQRVYISGDIAKPCTVQITDLSLSIVQALDSCDSVSTKKGGGTAVRNVRLIRNGQSTLINLNKLYAHDKQIPLQPGDKLMIDDTANRIFMVGEFNKQTALPYATGGMSLSDAISDVGGLNLKTADTSHIYVIRGFVGGQNFKNGGIKTVMHPKIYSLNMSNPSGMLLANRFQLKPRDVVFASPASLVNFNRALSLILPSLNALTQGTYFYKRSGL